jgi:hypothetical protein
VEGVRGSMVGEHYRTQGIYGFMGGWELAVMDVRMPMGGGYSGSKHYDVNPYLFMKIYENLAQNQCLVMP